MSTPPPSVSEFPRDANPLPSLEELRERLMRPGAGLEETDALLMGLDRPPGTAEARRTWAEVARGLVEDPWLGVFSGSDGRRVNETAARALAALGEPSSTPLPAAGREPLEEARAPRPPMKPLVGPPAAPRAARIIGGGVTAVMAMGELLGLSVLAPLALPLIGGGVFLTVILPVMLMVRSRGQGLAAQVSVGLALLPGMVWVATAVAMALFGEELWWALIPLAGALPRLWAAWSLVTSLIPRRA